MPTYVSPFDETSRAPLALADRPPTLEGRRIGLLDIAKPRGAEFLDRTETLLAERFPTATVVRLRKPTPSRPAPADVAAAARRCDAVLVALAD